MPILADKWGKGPALGLFFALAFVVFFLDQASKSWVVKNLIPGETWPLLGNILFLTYVRNPGAAFGLFPGKTPFFMTVSLITIGLILVAALVLPSRHLLLRCGLAVLFGGIAGNLYDRLQTGFVIDFLDLRFWPVFNLADVAIVMGVFCVALDLARRSPFEQLDPGSDRGG